MKNYFDTKIFFLLLHPAKIVPMKRLLSLLVFFVCSYLQAANGPPPPTTPPPPGTPIDSGIVFLVLISVFFAYYKYNLGKKELK